MVGVWTGYKDKNGAPIHEGDRVMIVYPPQVGTVVWLPEIKQYGVRRITLSGHSLLLMEHLPRVGVLIRRNWLTEVIKVKDRR